LGTWLLLVVAALGAFTLIVVRRRVF